MFQRGRDFKSTANSTVGGLQIGLIILECPGWALLKFHWKLWITAPRLPLSLSRYARRKGHNPTDSDLLHWHNYPRKFTSMFSLFCHYREVCGNSSHSFWNMAATPRNVKYRIRRRKISGRFIRYTCDPIQQPCKKLFFCGDVDSTLWSFWRLYLEVVL